jgi:glycogen(starch) synthase
MHIAMVTPAFAPDLGGGERYVYHLARTLVERGHRVTVVTSNARAEADFWRGRDQTLAVVVEQEDDLRVVRCRLPGFKGGESALQAWRRSMIVLSTLPQDQTALLSRMAQHLPPLHGLQSGMSYIDDTVEVIHGFNLSWEHTLVEAWRTARRQSLPLVVTPFAHVGTGRAARNLSMDHQRRLLLDANHVQALSATEREGLILWGVPEEQVDVVGSGYVPPAIVSDRRQRYGLSQRYAIFIGRLTYDKGAMHAVEAVLALSRRGGDLDLVLVGETTPAFETFYARLTTAERQIIRPLGRVDEQEKHGLLAGAEALLLPSRADALGIVLLEAWSHAKPVIAARAGGIPGVVEDNTDGLLVPFGDVRGIATRLRYLLDNPTVARELGQKGWHKATSDYSWPAVADRVLRGYDRARRTFAYAQSSPAAQPAAPAG